MQEDDTWLASRTNRRPMRALQRQTARVPQHKILPPVGSPTKLELRRPEPRGVVVRSRRPDDRIDQLVVALAHDGPVARCAFARRRILGGRGGAHGCGGGWDLLGGVAHALCSGCRRPAATGARCGEASAERCPLGGAVAERLGCAGWLGMGFKLVCLHPRPAVLLPVKPEGYGVAPEGCGDDWRIGANEEKTRFQPKLGMPSPVAADSTGHAKKLAAS